MLLGKSSDDFDGNSKFISHSFNRPNYVKRIPNEGLPLEQNGAVKGDLYIHFNSENVYNW